MDVRASFYLDPIVQVSSFWHWKYQIAPTQADSCTEQMTVAYLASIWRARRWQKARDSLQIDQTIPAVTCLVVGQVKIDAFYSNEFIQIFTYEKKNVRTRKQIQTHKLHKANLRVLDCLVNVNSLKFQWIADRLIL